MAPSISPGMISGIYDVWFARRNAAGYAVGTLKTPEVPVAGTIYGAYRTRAVVSFAPGAPTREQAQERGGQSLGPLRDLGPTGWGTPTITLSRYDERLDALINDYTYDVTLQSAAVITARNARRANPVPLIVGIVVGFDSEDDAENYLTIIYPNCTMGSVKPGSSQTGGTNPNPLAYQLNPSPSSRMGIGPLFSVSGLGLADNADTDFAMRAAYPYMLCSFVANGVLTTFKLPYLPISSDAVGTVANLISKTGVVTAVTSVVTTTGIVTLAAAGSSGDHWDVAYQTNFLPSP